MVRAVQAKMEETYGTEYIDASLNPYTGLRVTDISEDFERNAIVEEACDAYLAPTVVAGGLAPSGSFDANFRPKMFHYILYGLMGSHATVFDRNTEYVNKYSLDNPKSLTLEISDKIQGETAVSRKMSGVGISSMDFTFATNEFVTCSINWFAENYTPGTTDVTITSTEQPTVFWDAKVYLDSSTNQSLVFKNITMKISRGLDEEQYVIGSHYRQRLVMTSQTEITGSIDVAEWEKEELLRAMYGSTDGTTTTANALGSLPIVIKGSDFEISGQIVYETTSRSSTGVAEIDTSFDYRVLFSTDNPFAIYTETVV